jgi:hypothetical protein
MGSAKRRGRTPSPPSITAISRNAQRENLLFFLGAPKPQKFNFPWSHHPARCFCPQYPLAPCTRGGPLLCVCNICCERCVVCGVQSTPQTSDKLRHRAVPPAPIATPGANNSGGPASPSRRAAPSPRARVPSSTDSEGESKVRMGLRGRPAPCLPGRPLMFRALVVAPKTSSIAIPPSPSFLGHSG